MREKKKTALKLKAMSSNVVFFSEQELKSEIEDILGLWVMIIYFLD